MEKSNREYNYSGNVFDYDYFALYSSTSTITQKVHVRVQSTITPTLVSRLVVTANASIY